MSNFEIEEVVRRFGGVEMRVTLAKTEQADYVEMIPRFERSGPREVRFVDPDIRTVFKAFQATFRLGAIA